MAKNSWNKSMKNKHDVKVNTRIMTAQPSAGARWLWKVQIGQYFRTTEKEGSILKKNISTNTSKEGSSTTHPLKSFRLSCFMFVQVSLSFYLPHLFPLSLYLFFFPLSFFFFFLSFFLCPSRRLTYISLREAGLEWPGLCSLPYLFGPWLWRLFR